MSGICIWYILHTSFMFLSFDQLQPAEMAFMPATLPNKENMTTFSFVKEKTSANYERENSN